MNVAAYCRVSTDRDDQMNSLENQTSFFNEYIQRNPDWNFVGIYSDEGVTGTSVEKRKQFTAMIQDAKDGKIDLILTKEVSRFARNTVDTLNYTRELRRYDVGVYFINDNINTLESDGEFRLSIMASVAQEESRKTSARVKWGMKRQMEKGFVFAPPFLGYEVKNGVLTVNEEEAKIVRRIFDLYVNKRMGTVLIAQTLARENTPLTKKLKCWSSTAILRILRNEKYVGDLIQQKTIVKDYLTHKSEVNTGEKLIFKDHHEAIVDRTTWDEAQRILSERSIDPVEHNRARHTNKYWCSGKVECGTCHGSFIRKGKKALHNDIVAYHCKHTTYYENKTGGCTNTTYIDERILFACMQYVIQKLSINAEDIKNELVEALHHSKDREKIVCKLSVSEEKLTELNEKKKRMLSFLVDGIVSREDYQSAIRDLDAEITQVKNEIHDLKKEENRFNNSESQLVIIFELVAKYLEQAEPTQQIYSEVLEKIVVYDDRHVDIFIQGIPNPFSVKYYREGRGTQYRVYCEDYDHNITG